MVRRILVWRVAPVVAFAIAGGLMFALGETDGVLNVIGVFLLMVAGLLIVSFVFLEVGLSEDRERDREEQARRHERDARQAHPPPPARRALRRRRGH